MSFDELTQMDEILNKTIAAQQQTNALLTNMIEQFNCLGNAMGQPIVVVKPPSNTVSQGNFAKTPQIGSLQALTHIVDYETDELLKIKRIGIEATLVAIPPNTTTTVLTPYVHVQLPIDCALIGIGVYGTSAPQTTYNRSWIALIKNDFKEGFGSSDLFNFDTTGNVFSKGLDDAKLLLKGFHMTRWTHFYFDLTQTPLIFQKKKDWYAQYRYNSDPVNWSTGYLYQYFAIFDDQK